MSGDGSKELLPKMKNAQNSDAKGNEKKSSGVASNTILVVNGRVYAADLVTGRTVNVIINFCGEKKYS